MQYKFTYPHIDNFCDFGKMTDYSIIYTDFTGNLNNFLNQDLAINTHLSFCIARSLSARMSDPAIRYHTPFHICSMFQFYQEKIMPLNGNVPFLSLAQQLAIWFHDAIYVVKSGSPRNERNSVKFMESLLDNVIDEGILWEAGKIIEATSYHFDDNPAILVDANLILDIDLCNFAFDFENYQRTSLCVRKEYPEVSDEAFEARRKDILRALIKKGSLYRTDLFKEHFEQKAQENIQKTLAGSST